MSDQIVVVRIPGLTTSEKSELQKLVGKEQVEFYNEKIEGARHGDPFTAVAIIIVTISSLKALTAWLLKTSYRRQIKRTIEIEHPDGRKEKRTIVVDLRDSQAPEADILKVLGEVFEIDPKLLSPLLPTG